MRDRIGSGLARAMATAAMALLLASAAASEPNAAPPASSQPEPTRRFALVMGANSGGEGAVKLRYAVSDARSFASVLTELGGVAEADLQLLTEPGVAAFRSAASRMKEAAAEASAGGRRCEVLFYYSGHSDEEGLLLGKEKLGYAELRSAIESVPAAVRVAILDSCSSGSLTRAKGGSPRPAFLYDASSDMEGHAYITSSSVAEAAQESDKIGGSFFTNYLVSALRGAADSSGAGRVTLNEAYAYAFRETLASTENTQYGPQHPAYDISLTGSGDLVVTDLRSARAGLELAEDLSGSVYVRDSKGRLALELEKAAGDRMELGLPPGKYTVSLISGDARYQAEALVPSGAKTALKGSDFRRVAAQSAAARGAGTGAQARPESLLDRNFDANIAGFPISLGMRLLPDLTNGLFSSDEPKKVSFNLLWGQAGSVGGVQISSLLSASSGEMRGFQFAGLANASKGRVGGVQFAPIANVALDGFGGAQILSLVNVAGGKSSGAQVGLVNVASSIDGAQVGIVNVADRIRGGSIGLVNIETGGVLSTQAWSESDSSLRLGFAFGTRIIYTLASVGFGDGKLPQSPSASLGMGGRLTIGPFYGDLDLSWRELFGDAGQLSFSRPQARLEGRILAGFPAKGPGLIAGCALEAFVPGLSRENDGSAVSALRLAPSLIVGAKLGR
jgi:hypothetical protein